MKRSDTRLLAILFLGTLLFAAWLRPEPAAAGYQALSQDEDGAAFARYGENLITNGSGEASPASSAGREDIVPIPGWTTADGPTLLAYPAKALPAPTPAAGANFFYGGPCRGTTSAKQVIDVAAAGADIDAGLVAYALSGWLGGWESQRDTAVVTISFRDAAGATLGSAGIGPVTPAERSHAIALLHRATHGAVPAGTRSIQVLLELIRYEGCNNDGYADLLALVLTGGAPPAVDAGPDRSVPDTRAVAFAPAITDPDPGDRASCAWDFGDGSPAASGCDLGHRYPDVPAGAPPVGYTATLTVTDRFGHVATDTVAITVVDAAIVVEAGADQATTEGDTIVLALATFAASDMAATHTATIDWGDGSPVEAGVIAASGAGGTVSGAHAYADNGAYTITVAVTDSHGTAGADTFTVAVANVAPTVGPVVAPLAPTQVGVAIAASAPFADPGVLDTHAATWDWGDGTTSPGTVTEANGSGTVAGSHTYAAPGVYTLTLDVTDNDGGVGTATFQYVVAYDPSAGFVTGGGWIASPAGACRLTVVCGGATGKATFGFVAGYKRGATVPEGNTQFQFHAGGLNFRSVAYDWLVVAGSQAKYKGRGTINGAGDYGFLLTAIDGQPDRFRIKIWDVASGAVVYDNQMATGDDSDAATALGGGSIVIHC